MRSDGFSYIRIYVDLVLQDSDVKYKDVKKEQDEKINKYYDTYKDDYLGLPLDKWEANSYNRMDSGNYNKKTAEDLVDSSYYRTANSRKQILDNVSSNELRNKNENKNDPIYLEDDLSIYFRNRTLKDEYDDLGYELYENDEKLRYLVENKNDYSEIKTDFNTIEPSRKKLYGELKLRNNDFYSSVGADVILKNYDYLYVMDTVKKELELKNKAAQEKEITDNTKKTSNTKKVLESLKDRFKQLLESK